MKCEYGEKLRVRATRRAKLYGLKEIVCLTFSAPVEDDWSLVVMVFGYPGP